jgi:NADPH2:quinone reductase
VQLGALLGATVTAVASTPEKLEAARACGAQRLIDHRAGDLRSALKAALPGGAGVVVDPVGGDLAEPALRSLHYGGRFVTVGYASGTIPRIPLNLVLLKGVVVLGFQFRDFATHRSDDMARDDAELLDLLAQGRARPLIGATFDLSETAKALRHVAEGQAVGKVVLQVAPV